MEVFPSREHLFAKQVHGGVVREVIGEEVLGECDGLLTSQLDKALVISHADCQAAIFYDPVQHILANIHCGWRGNVQNIYKNAVGMFTKRGTKPSDLFVCISPSLGPQNAEFIHYQKEWPEALWKFRLEENRFDLWALSTHQLQQEGVLLSHIEVAGMCTKAQKEDFFSFRGEKITGRNSTIAKLL